MNSFRTFFPTALRLIPRHQTHFLGLRFASEAAAASPSSATSPTPTTVLATGEPSRGPPKLRGPTPLEKLQETPIQLSTPTGQEKSYEPKIMKIVDDICHLSLLEVADLNELLKKRLNIPDAPMMGAMNFASLGPAPPAEEEEAAAPVKVQTSFTLKLLKFDEGKKVPLIKECKSLLEGMNLVQAKKFVESAPCIIKADVSKDEAEKLSKALEAVGATCEIS